LAASTPGYPGLLREATPVNLLRIILGTYASADVGALLPDRYFAVEVTNDVTAVREIADPGEPDAQTEVR
jgi:hypothetical protein